MQTIDYTEGFCCNVIVINGFMCKFLFAVLIIFGIRAYGFYDGGGILSNDDWDGGISYTAGQKTKYGYKIGDWPGGAWISKNLKPFYLDEQKLSKIEYRDEVVEWRNNVVKERKNIATRIEDIMYQFKRFNVDVRIDTGHSSAIGIRDALLFLNSPLTRDNANKIYCGSHVDFESVKEGFKECTSMAIKAIERVELSKRKYEEEYRMVVKSDNSSVRGQYFMNQCKMGLAIIESFNRKLQGTGFIMNHRYHIYLYTNAHVLRAIGEGTVSIIDGGYEFPITYKSIIHVATDRDLARVVLTKPTGFCLKKSESSSGVKVGDEVHVYGNSMGKRIITVSDGQVIGVGPDMYEVTAPFVPGNSGSPVLNKEGEVIAVATSGSNDGGRWETDGNRYSKNRYFVTSVESVPWEEMTIQEFLRKYANAYK